MDMKYQTRKTAIFFCRPAPVLLRTVIMSVSIAFVAGIAEAQCPPTPTGHIRESTPRADEQRFNRFQYRSIHNAYLRDYPMNVHVDLFNAMQIEIDVRIQGGQWEVQHHCLDATGDQSLSAALTEVARSNAINNGFIVIDLETDGSSGGCSGLVYDCFQCFPSNWEPQLKAAILSIIPEDRFYTYKEFRECDDEQWPSIQELLRRGRHALVMFDGNSFSADKFFFDKSPACPTNSSAGTSVEYNTSDTTCVPHHGDTLVSRLYPTGLEALSCANETGNAYIAAMDNGFTFAATNCDDSEAHIFDSRIHPPVPTYVATGASEFQYGTFGAPWREGVGLFTAMNRAKAHAQMMGPSHIPISLAPGTYVLPAGVVLDASVTLSQINGNVVITK